MIIVSSIIQAKPGKETELEDTLKSLFLSARNETGLLTYILHRAEDNPGKFLFYERFRDKDALDYHLSSPCFKDSAAKVKDLVAEEPLVEFLEEVEAIQR